MPDSVAPITTTRADARTDTCPATSAQKQSDSMLVVLFYKYFSPPLVVSAAEAPQDTDQMGVSDGATIIRDWQYSICNRLELCGRVLVSAQGINGTVAGSADAIAQYTVIVEQFEFPPTSEGAASSKLFCDIHWKYSECSIDTMPFPDMIVRRVDELVASGGTLDVDVSKAGRHLTPQQFHNVLQEAHDDLVVLDVRNRWECAIGHFVDGAGRKSIHPNMRNFSQFREFVDGDGDQLLRGKRVLMYCTGGIRCETASAYLCAKGIASDVCQLSGGIHTYCGNYQDDSYFHGNNFVFDRRIALPSGSAKVVGTCSECGAQYDQFTGGVVCTVCVCLVLVCPACRKGLPMCNDRGWNDAKSDFATHFLRREWFCDEHTFLRGVYYHFLEPFPLDALVKQIQMLQELQQRLQNAEIESAEDAKGNGVPRRPDPRQRLLTVRKQVARIEKRIRQLSHGAFHCDASSPLPCRCCNKLGCDGYCWGFWEAPGTKQTCSPPLAKASPPPNAIAAHLSEQDAGIVEFLNPNLVGFSFRFKERARDFQVHEVSVEGEELHLTELFTQQVLARQNREDQARKQAIVKRNTGPGFTFLPEQAEVLQPVLGEEGLDALQTFLRLQSRSAGSSAAQDENAVAPPPFVDIGPVGDGSKEARTRAHQAVKELFGVFLSTESIPGKSGVASCQRIRVWMSSVEKKMKSVKLSSVLRDGVCETHGAIDGNKCAGDLECGALYREAWPKDRPEYLRFRLHKEDCDLIDAIGNIAKCVGRKDKDFGYAGIKDRRAITVQHISVSRLREEQLKLAICNPKWDRRLYVSDFEYVKNPVKIGDLQGNCFAIVLRGLSSGSASLPEIRQCFESVRNLGFLNYFGLQRFGTRHVRTHHIGMALIAGRWDAAVRLILGDIRELPEQEQVEPTTTVPEKAGGVSDGFSAHREIGNVQLALAGLSRGQHIERTLLKAVAKGMDSHTALQQLPFNTVKLYAHAAQSLIWNAVLTKRIQKFGRTPVAGDLVICGVSGGCLHTVRELQDADVADSKIQDVVLPLPGFGVEYPQHMQQYYEEASNEFLGMPLESFHKSLFVELEGSYRHIVVRPDSLQWELEDMGPKDVERTSPLSTDVDHLQKNEHCRSSDEVPLRCDVTYDEVASAVDIAGSSVMVCGATDGGVDYTIATKLQSPSNEFVVVLRCKLPPSVYLTMLLREILLR